MHICNTTPIKTWKHTFLESGHTFLPNDTDFGRIEREKKHRLGIYTYQDWEDIIKKCKFSTIHMKDNMFDVTKLTANHSFRHSDLESNKFSWLKLKALEVNSESAIMAYKFSSCKDERWKEIDFFRKETSCSTELEKLYNGGLPIKKKKYDDVISLLNYIPGINHDFFLRMRHDGQEEENAEVYPDSGEDE